MPAFRAAATWSVVIALKPSSANSACSRPRGESEYFQDEVRTVLADRDEAQLLHACPSCPVLMARRTPDRATIRLTGRPSDAHRGRMRALSPGSPSLSFGHTCCQHRTRHVLTSPLSKPPSRGRRGHPAKLAGAATRPGPPCRILVHLFPHRAWGDRGAAPFRRCERHVLGRNNRVAPIS